MKTKAFWGVFLLLLLSACGPMIGGMMVANNGVKDFKTVQGDIAALQPGSRIAVLGPFDKTSEAFYICRGEEAASFTSEYNLSGLFSAELKIDTRFPDKLLKAQQFKGQTSAEVQKGLGLQNPPDLVMSGTILSREMVAAPANGVIMTANYRLEFLTLSNGQVTVVEVKTRELFQEVVPETVKYMAGQLIGK